jgi:thioesterase domain-containing protein
MQQSILQDLQATFYHEIPLTRHIGIQVIDYQNEQLTLSAPLKANINHKQTAFAGSLNAILTLAGWGQLWLILKEHDISGKIVIQDSSSNYLRPVNDNITAICKRPKPDQVEKLCQALLKHGKARIELSAAIYEGEKTAVDFKGRYVVFHHP